MRYTHRSQLSRENCDTFSTCIRSSSLGGISTSMCGARPDMFRRVRQERLVEISTLQRRNSALAVDG